MRARSTTLIAMVLSTLAACVVVPPPSPEELREQSMPALQLPEHWTTEGAATAESVANAWLSGFGDPRLESLVAEAMLHNPDLYVTAARVEVAAQYVELADSTLWPQVNLLARGGGQMGGDASGLQGVGLFADWELDLWGRVRSAKAAQAAGYEAAVADAWYARQSVAALVAKSYFLAVEAGTQQRLAEEIAASAQQLVTLAEQRERIGRGDGYELALSRANAATFRDTVEQFRFARDQSLRALEALLGRYPAAATEVAAEPAQLPGSVPAGLPSELLERRPDVIAAERRVAAAFHGIQEAKAARLPTIKLTGSVNDVSSDLFVLQDRDNPVWSAGASLLLPVFNAGGLASRVRIRTAEQQQAVAEYGRIGARAFGEVENALSAEFAAGRREENLALAAAENQRALELSRVRFDVGSGDLRAVQQQQIAAHGSRSALVRVQTERLVQRVNLYLALGGGFDAEEPPATVAEGGQ